MKRDTVILVVLLTLGSFSFNAQSSKSEKVIVDRSRLFNQAFLETRDSMMLNDLLSVKGLFGNFENYIQAKASSIRTVLESKIAYDTKPVEDITVVFGGKSSAVSVYILEMIPVGADKELSKKYRVMLFWAKEKGKWKLLGSQPVYLEK